MSDLFVDNIKHQSSQGSGTITLGASGETVALASGASQTMAVNTPAFEAHSASEQTLSDLTYTQVTLGTEILDTDGNFASSRFTPTTAGKYFIYGIITVGASITNRLTYTQVALYKNGSIYKQTNNNPNDTYPIAELCLPVSAIVDMNGSTDYVELYAYLEASSANPTVLFTNKQTSFGGYRIIGA
jgi:hypothetical protein